MKFAIAAVALIAVVSGVQSSLISGIPGLGLGLGHGIALEHGHGLGHGSANLGLGLAGQSLVQGPAVLGAGIVSHGHLPAAVNVVASPAAIHLAPHAVVASHGSVAHHAAVVAPHAAVVAAPLAVEHGHSHGASYVAKNRGAIHTAPLPGHVNSAASVNLAPAPGTW